VSKSNDFMPGEPTASTSGDYLRLKDLETYKDNTVRLRILHPFISGFEGWTTQNKPIRAEGEADFPKGTEWKVEKGEAQRPRRFWATAVWNSNKERVQVFSFTQATIYRQLKSLLDNEDWGLLTEYDVTVRRTGSGTETEYTVLPCPKKGLSPAASKTWEMVSSAWIGLAALYSGGHPLATFDTAVAAKDLDIPFD